jgi:hypothetical protein
MKSGLGKAQGVHSYMMGCLNMPREAVSLRELLQAVKHRERCYVFY